MKKILIKTLLLCSGTFGLYGQELVKDINSNEEGSSYQKGAYYNGFYYFSATDEVNGNEIWRTNGTSSGTQLYLDLNVGAGSSNPRNFIVFGGELYFTAYTQANGVELWKTDGNSINMVKDINVGTSSSSPQHLISTGSFLIFSADDGVNGVEIWSTDGTAAGTAMLEDINLSGNSIPEFLTLHAGLIYFRANNGTDGYNLYATNGDPNAIIPVSLIKDIIPGSSNSGVGGEMISMGGELYFSVYDALSASGKYEVWKSDGTSAGTVEIDPSKRFLSLSEFTIFNNYLHFIGSYSELWRTDGTAGGTTNLGFSIYNIQAMHVFSSELYVAANNNSNGSYNLYKMDVTNNLSVLHDFDVPASYVNGLGEISDFFVAGTKLYFTGVDTATGLENRELYVTDGTILGTGKVIDLNGSKEGSIVRDEMTPFSIGNELYFKANDGVYGDELYHSDGTALGTSLVKNINGATKSANIKDIYTFGDQIIFALEDYLVNSVYKSDIYFSDGTSAGTDTLISLKSSGGNSNSILNLSIFDSSFTFTADDINNGQDAWFSKGNKTSTISLNLFSGSSSSGASNFVEINGDLYTRANDGSVFKYDGNTTTNVGNIGVGPYFQFLDIYAHNGFIYSNGGGSDDELWKFDPISQTASLVKNISTASSSYPYNFHSLGGNFIFHASGNSGSVQPFYSDGTTAGTNQIKVINPNGHYILVNEPKGQFTELNGYAYFVATNDTNGHELWRTDGTALGTIMIKDIRSGGQDAGINYLTVVGNEVYFTANDGISGNELWKTDGTSGGTLMVIDLNVGPSSTTFGGLTTLENKLYFAANATGYVGYDIWSTDGITLTKLTSSSYDQINSLKAAGRTLFFAATDAAKGNELYKYCVPTSSFSISTSTNTICEGDTIQLTTTGAYLNDVIWNGSFSDSSLVSPSITTQYIAENNLGFGCSQSDTLTVMVNSLPAVQAQVNSSTICSGDSVVFTANGADNYQWTDGILGGNSYLPVSKTYFVTGTDTATGCSNIDSIAIIVNTPQLLININDTTICFGDSILLEALNTISSSWTGGIIDGSYNYPVSNQIYYVSGTDINGCLGIDSVEITVFDTTDIFLDTLGFSLKTNATGSYQWLLNGNVITGATNQSYVPVTNGSYQVVVTNANCTDTSSVLAINTVTVEQVAESEIKVYPNPFKNELQIDGLEGGDIQLINSLGQPKPIKVQGSTLNTSGLISGVYYIFIYNTNGEIRHQQKLLKN